MSDDQYVPEIPSLDPKLVTALMKCMTNADAKGDTTLSATTRAGASAAFFGDEMFMLFSDGSSMLMLQCDEWPPDSDPRIAEGEGVQVELANVFRLLYAEPDAGIHADIAVEDLLAWAAYETEACPRCKGTRVCLYPPRHAYAKEQSVISDMHKGYIGEGLFDRRRVQVPLRLLGLTEGVLTAHIYEDTPANVAGARGSVLYLEGGGWWLVVAGLARDSSDDGTNYPKIEIE
jgi:hypothetical protein